MNPDPGILEAGDGPREPRDDALKRLHRLVMGPASGMVPAVFPSKLLLLSTHNVHTTLVELCLEQTANRPPNFRFVKQPQRIKQEDDIVCSLMAICRLILKLTEEELMDIYWTPCVQIIRTFFDLELFLKLENS